MLIEIGGMVLHAIRGRFWPGVLSAATLTAAAACSSSSSTATAPAATVCPSTYAAASGAACNVASESCPYIMPCGAFEALVTCVCTGGTLVCGATASADGSVGPICPPATPAPACPITETLASVAACSDVEQQCAYPAAPGSIPAYDVCACTAGRTATEGLHFECTQSMGLPDASGPATDAGANGGDANIPDAAVDAPFDGAAPSLDGATEQ
jgi:hypothetical protein